MQSNHVHLLVESDDALAPGMQGLAIRLAKAVNRALGRYGRVWSDRYHAHALRTPREVRNALVYVLLNGRRHRVAGPRIDPCSSGAWFDGVCGGHVSRAPVARPRTWLLSVGWRRAGTISLDATPAVE